MYSWRGELRFASAVARLNPIPFEGVNRRLRVDVRCIACRACVHGCMRRWGVELDVYACA